MPSSASGLKIYENSWTQPSSRTDTIRAAPMIHIEAEGDKNLREPSTEPQSSSAGSAAGGKGQRRRSSQSSRCDASGPTQHLLLASPELDAARDLSRALSMKAQLGSAILVLPEPLRAEEWRSGKLERLIPEPEPQKTHELARRATKPRRTA
jgi:hypothetical protein